MYRYQLTAIAICGLASTASAAILQVPETHATIQQAINQADDGDTVVVAPGTYNESLTLNGKSITLRSSSGADATIIDASGLGQVSAMAIMNGEGPSTVIEGFTMTGGRGTEQANRRKGGGLFIKYASPTVNDCIITDNRISAWDFSIDGSGGGVYIEGGSPSINDCVFSENELVGCSGWLNGGAGVYCDAGATPTLTNCSFLYNEGNNGGGIMNVSGAHATLINCYFEGNDVYFSGGGLNNTGGASATVVNSIFKGNFAYHGAGLYLTESYLELTNCTVTQNMAESTGGGAYLMYASDSCAIANCIFWNNSAPGNPEGKELDRYAGAISTVNNSNIQGGWSGPGWSNIDANPMFTADFSLQAGSPSIDSGANFSVPAEQDTDFDGDDRIDNDVVDMGAHEFQTAGQGPSCPADLTGDGSVTVTDLIELMSAWGTCSSCSGCIGDLDGNCFVDVSDVITLFNDWGSCD